MRVRSLAFFILLFGLAAPWAYAGPPFLTDDPEPVPFKNAEFYIFTQADRASDGTSLAGPAFEFNVGAAPNLQLHVVASLQWNAPYWQCAATCWKLCIWMVPASGLAPIPELEAAELPSCDTSPVILISCPTWAASFEVSPVT